MIHYSTNFMGPISTKWYDENNIPYEMAEYTNPRTGTRGPYKKYDSYCGGRIDICGLDKDKYWNGKYEFSLSVMKGESWSTLSEWLDSFESEKLVPYEELIERFENETGHKIQWWETESDE